MTLLTALGVASMVFVAWWTWRAYYMAPGLGQTPRSAIFEAWINILVGFSLNYGMNLLLIPLAMNGQPLGLAENWWLGWVFTTVSIARQYLIRRFFNARLVARMLAGERHD